MLIRVTRNFERTRQIADFVPVKASCEASAEIEIETISDEKTALLSDALDRFVQREVERTLAGYVPMCLMCGMKAIYPVRTLGKDGICAQCTQNAKYAAMDNAKGAAKKLKEKNEKENN